MSRNASLSKPGVSHDDAQASRNRTVTYQVVIGPLADVARLHAQVLERLGGLVNDLVVELALDLVGGHDVPPDEAVEQPGGRLQERLGHVDVPAPLVDFAVDQLGDLGRRVVLGAEQLIGLGRRVVVVQHLLERLTDVDDLQYTSGYSHFTCFGPCTYMHRPVPLLHVVRCEEVRDAGELQQQPVFEAEHRGRPDNGGLGEDIPHHFLGITLEASQTLSHHVVRPRSGVGSYLGREELGG